MVHDVNQHGVGCGNISGMDAKTDTTDRTMYSVAVLFASLVIPAPVLTGRIVEAILDTTNPANIVDLRQDLAYLTEILTWSFAVAGTVVAGFILSTVTLWAKAKTFASIRLPVIVFGVQILLAVAMLLLNQVIDAAEGS